jgi:uncharacterized protein (TIGR02266 family)
VNPQRAPVVFPVRFEAEGNAVQTTTREVGLEGVFIRSQKSPKQGATISLRLHLPGNVEPDEVRARVVEVRPDPDCGFWAAFIDPQAQAIERIKLLLERRARAAAGGAGTPIGVIQLKQDRAPAVEARRGFPRHAARFRVGFTSNHEFAVEYAENISVGGVFVHSDDPPELDSIVSVSLHLPGNGTPVEAKALVVHRVTKAQGAQTGKRPGMGVQFLDSSDEFRAAIDGALEHILKTG